MRPLQVRENGELTTSVGRIIDKSTLVYIEDTVLDEKHCKKGAFIDLPVQVRDLFSRDISQVYFPAFQSQEMGRLLMLNPMAASANLLLRIIEDFKAQKVDVRVLGKMTNAYQAMAVRLLSGKGGLVNSHILSTRVSNSGRAVLLISADYSPEFVGIPDRIMYGLGIRVGDPVIVGRDPAIWDGSIEICRAKHSGSNCIEMHPLLFKQMGADCDGDCVFVWKLPDTEAVQTEAENGVLSFVKRYGAWPTCLKTPELLDDKVNWETVHEDSLTRAKVTGFSVSPREILEGGPRVQALCTIMGKDVAKECKEIALGLTFDQVKEHLLTQNATQLEMKVKLGPIGAASNRLKVLAGENPELQRSACYVSERLQQMLLSSKHVVGGTRKQAYSVDDVLRMLNRRNQWREARLQTIIIELEKMGMERAQFQPIVAYLWMGYPMQQAVAELMGPHGTRGKYFLRRMSEYIRQLCFDLSKLESMLAHFEEYGSRLPVPLTRRDLYETFQRHRMGLNDICKTSFPVHEIASGNKPLLDQVALAARIALEGESDVAGIGAMSIRMARVVQSAPEAESLQGA